MMLVELYSKNDCHLCDVAKGVLKKIQATHPFELQIIEVHEGERAFDEFKDRIPVVFIDKGFAFQHRVPEKEFIRKLKDASTVRES